MLKKVMSLALASALVLSTGVFAASAVGAENTVVADDSTAVAADNESEADTDIKIYFDVESAGWNDFETVFCHIWRADGTGTWPGWQLKAERCTDEGNGIYSYDLTKTKNEIKHSDGNLYCVVFSTDTNIRTYNTIMSGSCIGDTLYCKSQEQIGHPEENNLKCYLAEWKNNSDCGPQKAISSTGTVVGTAFAEGDTDATLLADYLLRYVSESGVADTGKTDKTQELINELNVSATDVMDSVKSKNEEAVAADIKTQKAADKQNATIKSILFNEPIEPIPDEPSPTEPDAPIVGTKIYFDAESTGWKNYKNIFCHIWRADGTGKWPVWQTRKELCEKEANGLYSYDISKTGNAEEIQSAGDRNLYCVIFSADTGVQTYNTIMNGNCIGDTCYITGNELENPVDSQKKAIEAVWRNNPNCGPQKVISSTGAIVGTALAEGTTDVTLLADYLLAYVSEDGIADTAKTDKTQELIKGLNVSATDVMDCVKSKNEEAVAAGYKTQEAVDKQNSTIETILAEGTAQTIGDMNNDGKLDVTDVTAIQIELAKAGTDYYDTVADTDRDGKVDVADVTFLQQFIASTVTVL